MGSSIYARPQFWWRLLIVLVGVVGLLSTEHRVLYFTVQSNLLTVGYFACALYWMVQRGTTEAVAPRLRGGITMWMLITCLISHVMLSHLKNPLPGLAADNASTQLFNWSLFLVHYVVPLMVLVDWVAFGPHRQVRWRDIPLWIAFPLGYGLVILFRAALVDAAPIKYPYPFLNAAKFGYDWVGIQFAQLAVIFTALGALIVGLDRLGALLGGRGRKEPGESDEAGEQADGKPVTAGAA